jgi:large subunit ribosomal protein L24
MKLKKGDKVQVLQGKDRGKEGTVMRVLPGADRVIVDGGAHPIGLARRHQRAQSATRQGGIIDKFMPLPASAVALVCPTDGPTRAGYRFEETAGRVQKVRICKKCGAEL